MPTPISEPDGNTRGARGRALFVVRIRSDNVAHGAGQIAGNYFMANGRVMHLRIINSAMERICAVARLPNYLPTCPRSDQFPAVSTTFRLIGHPKLPRPTLRSNPLMNILHHLPGNIHYSLWPSLPRVRATNFECSLGSQVLENGSPFQINKGGGGFAKNANWIVISSD